MSYRKFKLAFWHPFGPHGGETPEEIIDRKNREIQANGWTLRSFQHRAMLEDWLAQIRPFRRGNIYAFCSDGRGAKEPAGHRTLCSRYRPIADTEWSDVPKPVRVPHPFPAGMGQASAFIVQRITHPVQPFPPTAIEWLHKDGNWRQDQLPTRPEYLIRQGGTSYMRTVRAVLELKPPYLARLAL